MSVMIARGERSIPASVAHAYANLPSSIAQMLRDGCYERREADHGGSSNGASVSFIQNEEVVIDCLNVITISSDDLNALIRFHTCLRHESCRVVLSNVQEQIAEIFALTRLNRLFLVQALDVHVST